MNLLSINFYWHNEMISTVFLQVLIPIVYLITEHIWVHSVNCRIPHRVIHLINQIPCVGKQSSSKLQCSFSSIIIARCNKDQMHIATMLPQKVSSGVYEGASHLINAPSERTWSCIANSFSSLKMLMEIRWDLASYLKVQCWFWVPLSDLYTVMKGVLKEKTQADLHWMQARNKFSKAQTQFLLAQWNHSVC